MLILARSMTALRDILALSLVTLVDHGFEEFSRQGQGAFGEGRLVPACAAECHSFAGHKDRYGLWLHGLCSPVGGDRPLLGRLHGGQ